MAELIVGFFQIIDIGNDDAHREIPADVHALKLGLKPVSQRLQVSAQCIAFRQSGRCPNRLKK